MLYRIDLPYACFGIVTHKDIVVRCAPISKWTLGKNIQVVIDFYKKKGAKIDVLACE